MDASTSNDGVEDGHGGIGVDGVGDQVRQRLPGELVDDVEQLEHPAVGCDVELVVHGPDVVGVGSGQAVGRRGRAAHSLALAALLGNPQALLPP